MGGGEILTIKVFVTPENLEKLDRIREFLNSRDDVKYNMIDPWTEKDVNELLFNAAIENFKLK